MKISIGLNFLLGLVHSAVILTDVTTTTSINKEPQISISINQGNSSHNRPFGVQKKKIINLISKKERHWQHVIKSLDHNSLSETDLDTACLEKYPFIAKKPWIKNSVNKSKSVINPNEEHSRIQIPVDSNRTENKKTAKIFSAKNESRYGKRNYEMTDNPDGGQVKSRTKRQIQNVTQLKLNTTVGGTRRQDRLMVIPGSNLTVESKECGFVFCFAEDFHLNNSIHRWDYHVEWSFPSYVTENVNADRIFVLGDHFQMAHAYLVFRGFDKSYEGEYICRLTLFGKTVVDVHVNLVFSDALSSKQCIIGNS